MSLNTTMSILIPIAMTVLAALMTRIPIILSWGKQDRLSPSSPERFDASKEIVESIPTNNTYPQLEEIFNTLERELSKRNLKMYVNLEGYTSNGYKR